MAKIKTLKDGSQEILYPISITEAILNSEGVNLEALLASKANHEDNYTKGEVDEIIKNLSSLKLKVLKRNDNGTIPGLPAKGDVGTVYLVPSDNGLGGNYYDEYICLEGGVYEKIGATDINPQNYYTKTEAKNSFLPKVGEMSRINYNDKALAFYEDIPLKTSELTNDSNFTSSDSIMNIWTGTQQQYDALSLKSETTLYLVVAG